MYTYGKLHNEPDSVVCMKYDKCLEVYIVYFMQIILLLLPTQQPQLLSISLQIRS